MTPDGERVTNASAHDTGDLALVLTGGGARGAYQVGVLRALSRRFPSLRIPILFGVSAGAVNAVHLAHYRGSFDNATESLARLWTALTPDRVFDVNAWSLFRSVMSWGVKLVSGGHAGEGRTHGLVDTTPLRGYLQHAFGIENGALPGIQQNLDDGLLRAVAVGTTSYSTGQSIVWVQGREIELWERAQRRSVQAQLGVEHIMASSALPLLFPAERIGDQWYGDGGIRLAAPLSPALHLGASKIIVCSTRYERSRREAARPLIAGYPPPAQIMGVLYNSVFLDLIDQDVLRLQRLNHLIEGVPETSRSGFRLIDIFVMRPSQDIGRIASKHEQRLPRAFRFLTRGLGTRQTASPDMLSLILFQKEYVGELIELGERDGAARADELAVFLDGGGGDKHG